MKYVIIGNSASGIAAVSSIREYDKTGKITIISSEPYLNYSRPLISYLLAKKIGRNQILYRDKDFYKKNKVDLVLKRKAVKLNLKRKRVLLDNKQEVPFDKLLIATGGKPINPEVKGIDAKGVFNFVDLSCEEQIERFIKNNKVKNAVIMGGGLIGLKAAEALIALNIKLTLVELADRVLSSTFDKKASLIIEEALKKHKCDLITKNTIVEVKTKNNIINAVELKDKSILHADLLISAIGVRPNIELVNNTSIKTNRGIIADKFMRTNIKDIYVAGDCCEASDLISKTKKAIAIWPLAVLQGKIAGYNMAGIRKEYPGGFAMNSVELCGIPTISAGETNPVGTQYEIISDYVPKESIYRKIVLKENRIVGVIFMGKIERAGIYIGLIKEAVNLASCFFSESGSSFSKKEYFLKDNFGLISLPQEYRKYLVSGEVAII
ncbi:MAG: FAD-dependent oxidoreductase [Candidatus Omnitrophota bacterium]